MVKVFIWRENESILNTDWKATGWLMCNRGQLYEILIDYKHVKWFYCQDLTFFGIYAGTRYMIQKDLDQRSDGVGTLWRE